MLLSVGWKKGNVVTSDRLPGTPVYPPVRVRPLLKRQPMLPATTIGAAPPAPPPGGGGAVLKPPAEVAGHDDRGGSRRRPDGEAVLQFRVEHVAREDEH